MQAHHKHQLSSSKDQWFLERNLMDPCVYKTFEAGDEIVLCNGCRTAYLSLCWENSEACPSCGAKQSCTFSKSNIRVSDPNKTFVISSPKSKHKGLFGKLKDKNFGIIYNGHSVWSHLIMAYNAFLKWFSMLLLMSAAICTGVKNTLLDCSVRVIRNTFTKTWCFLQSAWEKFHPSVSKFLDVTSTYGKQLWRKVIKESRYFPNFLKYKFQSIRNGNMSVSTISDILFYAGCVILVFSVIAFAGWVFSTRHRSEFRPIFFWGMISALVLYYISWIIL